MIALNQPSHKKCLTFGGISIRISQRLHSLAKNLRKDSTEAEKSLWRRLQRKQLEEFKFRRQQPIGKYIVDFVCFEKKLVVEVDGGQHADTDRDRERDRWLAEQGFQVLRF